MRHVSSLDLPRVSDGDGAPARRVLRLRADQRCRDMLRPDAQGQVAYIEVPSREPVVVGESVRVEISFGALSDEVELDGRVDSIDPAFDDAPPKVVIRLGEEHVGRARYVRAVLSGDRPAAARSHRRIPTDLACRWTQGAFEHTSRVRDLSRGGAFISSHFFPEIGTPVSVGLEAGSDRLRLDGVVSWVRPEGRHAGFGVSFKLRDRRLAERLFRVVRAQERPVATR